MDKPDFKPFTQMLDSVYALHGKSLTAEAKAIFFRAMAQYPLEAVRGAMDAHVKDPQRGQYPPKPADLIAQIVGNDGNRPGPEEAWAIAVRASDEAETVVMNDEIAEAWGVARPIFDLGDEIGARMAFKEAYQRITSRAAGPVKWWPSIGSDPHKRDAALAEARRVGLLPASQVQGLLPMAMGKGEKPDPEGLKRLREEVAKLKPASVKLQRAREERSAAERAQVAARKHELAASVTAYAKERA